jgi:hypothetical protein
MPYPLRRLVRPLLILVAVIIMAASGHAWGREPPLPSVSAPYRVTVYAHVPEPMKLSFAPDGSLYVGRQPGLRIHRVGPGGQPVTEFGPPMTDPDAVLVDAAAHIGGYKFAVLVGGGGVLAAIRADETSSVLFDTGFDDVDDMKFDRHRRLVFSDDRPRVLSTTGAPPTVLFETPTRPGSIAIDARNRIFVALADGTIRIYGPDGRLVDDAFATGLAGLDTYLAFPGIAGAARPAPLYVLSGTTLLRFTPGGKAVTIGTGFVPGPSSGTGFVFGPDGALYVSDYYANRILRISHRGRP